MSPKEFLDLIDPTGKRNEASARRYMRKLATGERSGSLLEKRAKADSGRTVNVRFRVGSWTDPATGEIFDDIRSANVTIPVGKSRLDFWKGDRLRKAVNKYLENSYSRRVEAHPSEKPGPDAYASLRRLPKGARMTEIRRVYRSRFPTQILR